MTFHTENHGFKLLLLGGFEASLDGRPVVGFAYSKMRALLAYLAVEREQDHRRDVLAELLWNSNPAVARSNLRRTLADLRRSLELPSGRVLFVPGKHTIRFVPNAYIDVLAFCGQPSALRGSDDADLACDERVVELYRGEFLAGLALPDCPDFEDWLQAQRERLHGRAVNLLERLSIGYGETGTYDKALQYALRQAELAPWDEEAHSRVMRFYALSGQTGAALRHYEVCSRQLQNELGISPSDEVRQLAERLRAGEFQEKVPAALEVSPPAERRQVTALYCALSVIASEDPEEWLIRLGAPQARCADIVRRFSGHIVQAHGGGLLAYFGFPQVSENAAVHAVQAGLAMAGEAGDGIGVQVGIHTGLIIADAEAPLMDSAGRTSKLAMQIRNCIGSGEVAISQDTQVIVSGYFDCVSLGQQTLPDFAQPQDLFKVVRESGARTRLEAAAMLTPPVGRETESAELMRLWELSAQGEPALVLIQGEAGIGKSRLLRMLRERLADRPHSVIELRCFPEISDSPLQPLIALFEDEFGFSRNDAAEVKFTKLASYFEAHLPDSAQQSVPLLAQLLSLPLAAPYSAPDDAPAQRQKQQIHALLLALLRRLAAARPLLLIVEDLHWIDPSTLELLVLLAEQSEKIPVLALLTARPEFVPPWRNGLTLPLAPLAEAHVLAMIAAIKQDMPAETALRIAERTDGVPLFVEEMAKAAGLNGHADIPPTLQDLLLARIERMGPAKYTAQLAAAIGREFSAELLRKASELEPAQLNRMLRLLRNTGLVLDAGATEFQFKHALIQEAVYASQTKAGRRAAHRRIAVALAAGFPDITEHQPELIARHFDAAGEPRLAIDYWLRAAESKPLYSSNVEVVGYLQAGLKALDGLADGIEKDRLAFALQVRLGFALQATQGYGAAVALQAFYQAMALSKKIGNTPGLFQAQLGLCIGISSLPELGNNSVGLKLACQLLRMAQESRSPALLQQAHHVVGNTLFWMGRFAEARFHQEQAIALDPDDGQGIEADASGRITSVTSQAFLSWLLWFQGFPEQAGQVSELSLSRARRYRHPNTLAFVLTFASALQRWLGNPEASLAFAEEGMALAQKMDFSIWHITNTMQQGWALAMQGKVEGVAQIRQCVDNMRIAMSGVIASFSLPLAEALLHHGQAGEALSVLDEALAESEKKHDYHFEAELHRLKGECLLAFGRRREAEACFGQALAVSREQEAKALELRALASLERFAGTR
ncbi:MAG: AAA family ATPase [Methylobacter sp.]